MAGETLAIAVLGAGNIGGSLGKKGRHLAFKVLGV